MRPLRFVRRNPLPLFGAFAAAFVVWVWQDPAPDAPPAANGPPRVPLRLVSFQVPEAHGPAPQATAQALPRLKPGMPRTEVEGLVGTPAADGISPATVSGKSVTYRMTYEADLGTLVTLEFDATKPGHPLVGVHCPDPLF